MTPDDERFARMLSKNASKFALAFADAAEGLMKNDPEIKALDKSDLVASTIDGCARIIAASLVEGDPTHESVVQLLEFMAYRINHMIAACRPTTIN